MRSFSLTEIAILTGHRLTEATFDALCRIAWNTFGRQGVSSHAGGKLAAAKLATWEKVVGPRGGVSGRYVLTAEGKRVIGRVNDATEYGIDIVQVQDIGVTLAEARSIVDAQVNEWEKNYARIFRQKPAETTPRNPECVALYCCGKGLPCYVETSNG
jgi:hypothetical protein